MSQSTEKIAKALEFLWKEEFEETRNLKREKVLEEEIVFDERWIAIQELKLKYPFLTSLWEDGENNIKTEYYNKHKLTGTFYLTYTQEKALLGKIEVMILNGEITRYSFEELASLLKPTDLN